MKELNSCNYELISGGIPTIAVAMAIGAGSGVASHIGSKIYSGEEITASGILASGIGGAFGGAARTAYRTSQATSAILGSFLGGASEEFTESLFKNKTQSGSDYNDGCNYC